MADEKSELTTVQVDRETREMLGKLAEAEMRSLTAEVKHLVFTRAQVLGVSILPCPVDGNPVPVVYVRKQEGG